MTLEQLAEQLKAGSITLAEWTAEMRDIIRMESSCAMELAKGGREFISFSDWGFVGSQVKKQYVYLDKFAQDILDNPVKWLNGRAINARMDLYGQLGYSALQENLQRENLKAGFTEERNTLEPDAAHCQDCLDETRKGWKPIGTLSSIGSRQCCQNDRCSIEYRKPDGAGGWIYGEE